MPDKKRASSSNIIYMLRTTQQHHVQLSLMADQKANFLLSAAFVLLAVLSGYIAQEKTSLTIFYIGFVLILVAIFAVISVSPRFKKNKNMIDDNMLFFGNFTEIPFEKFYADIEAKMKTDDTVYQAMAQDIYSIGQVLNKKKYKYLNISYRVFFYGIILLPMVAMIDIFLLQNVQL